MIKKLRIIALLSVAVLLSGCGILGLFMSPDVTGAIIVDDNGGQNLSSVTITVRSDGGRVRGLEYELQLANGTSLSAANAVLYEGTIDVPALASETVTVSRSQIDQYMTANSEVQNSPGGYYVLLHLDPNQRVPEVFSDFQNKQANSDGLYEWVP